MHARVLLALAIGMGLSPLISFIPQQQRTWTRAVTVVVMTTFFLRQSEKVNVCKFENIRIHANTYDCKQL
jgi:hypothetical protein